MLIKLRLINMAILSPANEMRPAVSLRVVCGVVKGFVQGHLDFIAQLWMSSHPALFAAGWTLLSFSPLYFMESMSMSCLLHIESCKHFSTLTQLFVHWRISVSAHSLNFFFLKDAKCFCVIKWNHHFWKCVQKKFKLAQEIMSLRYWVVFV